MMSDNPRTVWGEDGFATTSGFTTAHIADPTTSEYMRTADVWVTEGTGLPAGAYHDAPPARELGKAIVRNDTATGWHLITDLRGMTVYDISNGQAATVIEMGEMPEQYTLLPPSSQYDKWDGDKWVKDEAAEQHATLEAAQVELSDRIAAANRKIDIIKPAVDGGYAKPEHTQQLADWQRHRYELTLVPEQADWPESPQWPTDPDKVI